MTGADIRAIINAPAMTKSTLDMHRKVIYKCILNNSPLHRVNCTMLPSCVSLHETHTFETGVLAYPRWSLLQWQSLTVKTHMMKLLSF